MALRSRVGPFSAGEAIIIHHKHKYFVYVYKYFVYFYKTWHLSNDCRQILRGKKRRVEIKRPSGFHNGVTFTPPKNHSSLLHAAPGGQSPKILRAAPGGSGGYRCLYVRAMRRYII